MNYQFDTPILFIIFNRPDLTSQVFGQIRKLKPKHLFIAADGPRVDSDNDIEKCNETRAIISLIDWECNLQTLFRETNLGCGMAVSSAISWFFNHVELGIILEDDCFPSLSFFPFCKELLHKYKDDEQIMLIGGSNFLRGNIRGKGSYYFSKYPQIWGWASWKRAWDHYDYFMDDLENFLEKELKMNFSSAAERRFIGKKLLGVKSQRIQTWDYQWIYSILKNNGISITPNSNLIINIGFRNVSTHTFLKDSYREVAVLQEAPTPLIHPEKIVDTRADTYTFKNIYSYSLNRLFRLYKENGLLNIFEYLISKIK